METFFIVLAGITIIILLDYIFNGESKIVRLLRKSPTSKIIDVKHNTVEKIVGTAELYQKVLIAPISKKQCFYYQILVEEHVSDNDGHYSWNTYFKDERAVDFLVKDETGTALILAKQIQGDLIKDFELDDTEDNVNAIQKYVKSKGFDIQDKILFFKNPADKVLRIKEGIIHIGEKIAVKGNGKWELSSNIEEQKIIFSSTNEIKIILSDDVSTLE